MTTVLHRAQPLPLARLHTGVVLAVVVLHIGVLWLANLNWPLPTMVSGQVFSKARHSFFPGDHSNFQIVSNAGRQRFGRAETMLSLGNAPTNRSMPMVKGAGITSLAFEPESDALLHWLSANGPGALSPLLNQTMEEKYRKSK